MSTIKCECGFCGAELVRKAAPSIKSKLHFCHNGCKSAWQKTRKPVTRDWLYEHYVVKGLDTTQIGHLVGRDPKSVWSWLKDFGIQTRSRGERDNGNRFREGQPSAFQGRRHTAETRKKMSDDAKSQGRVPYDPAVGSYMKGRKGSQVPSWKGGVTPERQKVYSSPEWLKAFRAVWRRDRGNCQRCGRHKVRGDGHSFDVHHVVGFECVTLRCEVSNLVLLCEACHYWVHSARNVAKLFLKDAPGVT